MIAFGKAHLGLTQEQIAAAFSDSDSDAARYVEAASSRVAATMQALGFPAPTVEDVAAVACGIAGWPNFSANLAVALHPSSNKDYNSIVLDALCCFMEQTFARQPHVVDGLRDARDNAAGQPTPT